MRKKLLPLTIILLPLTYLVLISSFVTCGIALANNLVKPERQKIIFTDISYFNSKDDLIKQPLGISISDKNHLYVCDAGNGRVLEFNLQGQNLREFTTSGNEPFNYPVAVLADNEKVFVADLNRGSVDVLSNKGFPLFSIPDQQDASKVGAIKPLALAMDQQNHLFVADSNSRRILEFSDNGKFIKEIRAGNSDLWFVNSMAIDQSGNKLYALDTRQRQIVVFDLRSEHLSFSRLPLSSQTNSPRGMALDPTGKKLYVADTLNNSIYMVDLSTNSISRVALGGLNSPTGIAISGNHLVIADRDNNRIVAREIP